MADSASAIDLARLENEIHEAPRPRKFERRDTVPTPEEYCVGLLRQAIELVGNRGPAYGDVEAAYIRAAGLATLKLDREITPYMVAIVMESVKDARRAVAPLHVDSHIDGINYRAFAAQFALEKQPG